MTVLKIAIIGNTLAGKSALIAHLQGEKFTPKYNCSIPVDFLFILPHPVAISLSIAGAGG